MPTKATVTTTTALTVPLTEALDVLASHYAAVLGLPVGSVHVRIDGKRVHVFGKTTSQTLPKAQSQQRTSTRLQIIAEAEATGMSTTDLARRLGVSWTTAKSHLDKYRARQK